jgi:LysM repeat protein
MPIGKEIRNESRCSGITYGRCIVDRLEELKQKYQPVLSMIQQKGVKLAHMHVQDNKLFLQGAAPSEDIKNAIWNQIKTVDPAYKDLTCDLTVDKSLPQPVAASSQGTAERMRTYTVKAGDSLWKIAEQFYGKGTEYTKILAANAGKLKDEKTVIHPGDVLNVPA